MKCSTSQLCIQTQLWHDHKVMNLHVPNATMMRSHDHLLLDVLVEVIQGLETSSSCVCRNTGSLETSSSSNGGGVVVLLIKTGAFNGLSFLAFPFFSFFQSTTFIGPHISYHAPTFQ